MRCYCNSEIIIATHDDDQTVPPAAYGEGITVITVPAGFELQRFGEWTPNADRGETALDDPRPFARPQLPLAETKAQLKRAIDDAAELERLKYITPGAGQAMTYAEKATQARACLAAEAPEPENYSLLAAEIGITAETLTGVAATVAAAYDQWLTIGAMIEATRLGTKAAIDAAEDIGSAEEAAQAALWPSGV